MALLPEIINGQTVGSEVFDLISSYEPLTLSNCDLNFKKFKDSIKKGTPIPQCKFCPKNDNASLNRNYW